MSLTTSRYDLVAAAGDRLAQGSYHCSKRAPLCSEPGSVIALIGVETQLSLDADLHLRPGHFRAVSGRIAAGVQQ